MDQPRMRLPEGVLAVDEADDGPVLLSRIERRMRMARGANGTPRPVGGPGGPEARVRIPTDRIYDLDRIPRDDGTGLEDLEWALDEDPL